MSISLDNNVVTANDFTVKLSDMLDGDSFILKEVRFVNKYEDGENGKKVRTDVFDHTKLTVIDPETFEIFTIKVPKKVHIPETTERLKVDVDASKTFVKPYKIEYGKVKVSIYTDDVQISTYD